MIRLHEQVTPLIGVQALEVVGKMDYCAWDDTREV